MRTTLAWLITGLWLALYVRRLVDSAFPVPAEVTPVMLLAAGWLFGTDVRKKLKERIDNMLNDPEDRRK